MRPLTIVQVRAACDASELDRGPVLVTAVGDGQKIEWRTHERPQIGDRVTFAVDLFPTTPTDGRTT